MYLHFWRAPAGPVIIHSGSLLPSVVAMGRHCGVSALVCRPAVAHAHTHGADAYLGFSASPARRTLRVVRPSESAVAVGVEGSVARLGRSSDLPRLWPFLPRAVLPSSCA